MNKLFASLKNPKILRIVIAVTVFVLVVAGVLVFALRQGRVFIDNSLVVAPISSIAPVSQGVLSEIDVYEGERVQKGDPIAVIDGKTMYANTDGLIIMANNQIGSLVSAANPVAQLINPSDMRIAGTIDENKGLSDIRVGQVVSFTVDALPGKTFWGYVDEISPSAKQTQATFSISSERPTQQFVVYTRYNEAAYPDIKNGMSAKMTVFTNTK